MWTFYCKREVTNMELLKQTRDGLRALCKIESVMNLLDYDKIH